jgi:AcrR family transcriptional regulator
VSGRRLSPRDWCDAGLSLLRDEGMPALTVDRMCAALQRTKGSFYHHFRDLDAFLTVLLARWEEALTEAPIEFAAAEGDPRKRAARLDEAVARLDHRLDLAVRAWGLWDDRARAAVARVDARRLAYLTELYEGAGREGARELAQLEYVAFLGTQQVRGFTAPASTAQLVDTVRRALERIAQGALTPAPGASDERVDPEGQAPAGRVPGGKTKRRA